jgi:site-specific DNA-methyltransferase (adenine-specific)
MEEALSLPTPYWTSPDGRHVIYCASGYEIAPLLTGVDCLLVDPPYEITAGGGGIGATRAVYQQTEGFTDCGFDYSMLSHFPNWICFGTLRQVVPLAAAAGDRRWMLVTWNKSNPCPLVNGNYLPDTEYIVHAWSKGGLHGAFEDKARFIFHPLGDKEHGEHPNEKPESVMVKLVKCCSVEGETVLDPYMGSGTTGVACLRTGRRFIGIEKDPTHFKTALDRIQKELSQMTLDL